MWVRPAEEAHCAYCVQATGNPAAHTPSTVSWTAVHWNVPDAMQQDVLTHLLCTADVQLCFQSQAHSAEVPIL